MFWGLIVDLIVDLTGLCLHSTLKRTVGSANEVGL